MGSSKIPNKMFWWLAFPFAWGIHKLLKDEYPLRPSERRRLSRLVPSVQDAMLLLRNRMLALGFRIYIGQTSRSKKEQLENLRAGRSAVIKSWHRVNRAIDVYMIDPKTGKTDVKARNLDSYSLMHTEAKKLGFRVLGIKILRNRAGKTFRDPYHIEFRDGLTWSQAWRQAKRNA